MVLIARFRVDGAVPVSIAGLDGDWVQTLLFSKTFTSGIVGKATTLFMAAGSEEGSRSYVATERVEGAHRRRPCGNLDHPARRAGIGPGLLVRSHRSDGRHGRLRRMVRISPHRP